MRLRQIETALENALDGAFDRLIPGRLHPVEIFRQLWRSVEDERAVSSGTSYAPNRLIAKTSPEDFAHLESLRERLTAEFEANLEREIVANDWVYGARVLVRIEPDEKVRSGRVHVQARIDESPIPAQLAAEHGALAGRHLRVGPGTIMGRSTSCEIVIPDAAVSREHCRLDWLFEGYRITDLNSSNGTFVNGVRVSSYVLRSGDVIEVGTARLRFEYLIDEAWSGPETE